MMRPSRLVGALVLGMVIVVVVAAIVDARSRGSTDRPEGRPTTSESADQVASPGDRLTAERVDGVLYYSDPEDECRIHALQLPELAATPPPKLRACRFETASGSGHGRLERERRLAAGRER
jgi:hypothetical protein